MVLLRKSIRYRKLFACGVLLAGLGGATIPFTAMAQSNGAENGSDTQNGDIEPVPDLTVPPPSDPSVPSDCKVIDDELARIKKFSQNPKATKIQLDANAARADRLMANRENEDCPAGATNEPESTPQTPAPGGTPPQPPRNAPASPNG